jgi:predicted nucleotidyltransferase
VNSKPKYLYNCYCGPARLREDDKSTHPGHVYENCPRVTAPSIIAPKLSELKDHRMQKFYKNLDLYIFILKSSGIDRADLVGSFVRGQETFSSDIDIRVSCSSEISKKILEICITLNSIDGLSFDLTTRSDSKFMPHMSLPKGDIIKLFDNKTGYVYKEDNSI